MTGFHHVELWLADTEAELPEWRWLLAAIGLRLAARWPEGESWQTDEGGYLTLTASPNTKGAVHDRRLPGLNHVAFLVGAPAAVDAVMGAAPEHGWERLYDERYPHAGGPDHYAGYLANSRGYKVELVADDSAGAATDDPAPAAS